MIKLRIGIVATFVLASAIFVPCQGHARALGESHAASEAHAPRWTSWHRQHRGGPNPTPTPTPFVRPRSNWRTRRAVMIQQTPTPTPYARHVQYH